MPNWCQTTYCLKGKGKEIKKIHDLLARMEKENLSGDNKQDFGNMWLGNMLIGVGYSFNEVVNKDITYHGGEVRCRGWVTFYSDFDFDEDDLEDDDMEYIIETESAWCMPTGLIDIVIEKLAIKDVKIFYSSDEPGCEVFETNDDTWEIFPDTVYEDTSPDCDYKCRITRYFSTKFSDISFMLCRDGFLRLCRCIGGDVFYDNRFKYHFLDYFPEYPTLDDKEKIKNFVEMFNHKVHSVEQIDDFVSGYGKAECAS